ncbi:4-(cytidine 5'-diphospho)-2-C-methyl-D-erythritol kinase [Edaphobacter albus]|uniref:4-(cytidine 5'-diphospho)-2-C-methyl-D-erythritol kinase n=1 Tax=Edaphobacter sp. 4G125 TaxID=2763071 RepID=UPI001646B8F5|nr:4-(cytidine 5'-diphospho)-2-C-methyl-D-erythritol kinase [Edaphobacter sp. 4G125]QNI37253.1 4-(cytidine 5'-diphospho)-2-C-methyl-D-erythritol kinase [Edaphobacter sp. 4G125]
MPTVVRSYSKINLGLVIGPVRPDGFHGLTTLYQTLELHDLVTVSAARAAETKITLTTNDERVPTDAKNTCWKMVEKALGRLDIAAEVSIHIEKRLPVQGGMGAGSANAAAALIGLERELGAALPGTERLQLAGEVGSDVPLFLIGGTILGLGRGELVYPFPDIPSVFCVMAIPEVGVSTPQAFRDWDALELTQDSKPDRLKELSLAYASLHAEPGTSGIIRGSNPGNKQGGSEQAQGSQQDDLAENTLLSLVRTGVENDFERVVFPVYPSLREIKRELMGTGRKAALYAALSGSGSALFGLYRSEADARAAQQRVQDAGTKALITKTLPRSTYWSRMFAE